MHAARDVRWTPLREVADLDTIVSINDDRQYNVLEFARDAPERFLELVNCLCPRDQEIILCFAILEKRLTDLSLLFGKAGHRAEEDLHKAIHKLAGLARFGTRPPIEAIAPTLERNGLGIFNGTHNFPASLWQYARTRDFVDTETLIGPGLRRFMWNAFRLLHGSAGPEEGLLAGWILWLMDHSNPKGIGWVPPAPNKRYCLGPTVFHSLRCGTKALQSARKASTRGGQGQKTRFVEITRHMKFMLRRGEATHS